MVKKILTSTVCAICCYVNSQSLFAQGFNDSAYDMIQQDRFGAQFQNGDTNAPLLAMDWFNGPRVDYFCQVSRSGKVSSARDVINWAIQGGHWGQLEQTNLELLVVTINGLPPPPKNLPPQERWLVVRGVRKNQWFKFIYDRANVPKEVEQLFEITGAYLEWFIPKAEGSQVSSNLNAGEFYVARNSPKAVLFASTNILLFDLKKKEILKTIPIDLIPLRQGYPLDHVRTVSPSGNVIVESCSSGTYLDEDGICAVNLATGKILWRKEPLEHPRYGYVGSHVIIGGDKGQYLFACGAHTIERWDLASGTRLAVLTTNQSPIKWVEVSQNGKVFVAGFDNSTQDIPKSFTIWRADEDRPAAHFENFGSASACLSPDGRILALNIFGSKAIELRDWEHGTTKNVPLRLPYGLVWASKMFWSPDGTRLAAHLFGSQDTTVIYETTNWKPLANLPIAPSAFDNSGQFLQLRNGDIYSLDTTTLKSLGD